MAIQSNTAARPDAPWLERVSRIAGAAVALLGLMVIVSWHAHWRHLVQILPGSAPMQYNTALGLTLLGSALVLLTTGNAAPARWISGAVILVAALTLVEFIGGVSLGIDQVLFRPYFEVDTAYPGRMSPLAATCFVLIGSGILVVGAAKPWPRRSVAAGTLACGVIVVASVALLGFAFGIGMAYSWGSYSGMAVNTGCAFLALGGGLLAVSVQAARRGGISFPRWLPITGSVTLMAMIAVVSAVNMAELKKATFWRRHTFEVILSEQEFEENLIDIQRGARGYVTQGDSTSLASYKDALGLEPRQLRHLFELTSDNPVQQLRLGELAPAMDRVLSYDRRVISLYDANGTTAAARLDATGEGRALFGAARDLLKAFSHEEQQLLYTRDALEQTDARNAARLLLIGSVLATVLLLAALYMVSREAAVRRRAEAEREKVIGELRKALDEVRTLSGMIPICGWCKSIRSDQGYWQSVEQYVYAHTDATFTHGICPTCAAKFAAGIATPAGEKVP
jgi:CHASE3 domain sensor protein